MFTYSLIYGCCISLREHESSFRMWIYGNMITLLTAGAAGLS